MFDASEAADRMKPEAVERLRAIVRENVKLQTEAAEIMADEAERLSHDEESEQAARQAIAEWYGRLAVGGFIEAAEDLNRPEN